MLAGNQGKELRAEERLSVSLHASVADADCLTRDVSASGVYLESNATFDLGDQIGFVIELESPGGKLILRCSGEVVRVENRNGKVGVAVKIVESVMKSAYG